MRWCLSPPEEEGASFPLWLLEDNLTFYCPRYAVYQGDRVTGNVSLIAENKKFDLLGPVLVQSPVQGWTCSENTFW